MSNTLSSLENENRVSKQIHSSTTEFLYFSLTNLEKKLFPVYKCNDLYTNAVWVNVATWNIFYAFGFINVPAQINCHLFATIVTLDIDVRGKTLWGQRVRRNQVFYSVYYLNPQTNAHPDKYKVFFNFVTLKEVCRLHLICSFFIKLYNIYALLSSRFYVWNQTDFKF